MRKNIDAVAEDRPPGPLRVIILLSPYPVPKMQVQQQQGHTRVAHRKTEMFGEFRNPARRDNGFDRCTEGGV